MQTDTRRKEETGVELAIAEHDGGGRKLRLLLHACCGPCLAGVIDRVRPHFDITVFFFNPNILPKDEFIRRFDTLKLLLSHYPDVKLVAPEYDPTPFLTVSEGKTDLPEGGERCLGCFALRLGETARYLAAHGGEYDCFATTLTVSPRKNAQAVNVAGERAAEEFGVRYLTSDFKKKDGWLTSVRRSKELGLYRQHYCGCGFPTLSATTSKDN